MYWRSCTVLKSCLNLRSCLCVTVSLFSCLLKNTSFLLKNYFLEIYFICNLEVYEVAVLLIKQVIVHSLELENLS